MCIIVCLNDTFVIRTVDCRPNHLSVWIDAGRKHLQHSLIEDLIDLYKYFDVGNLRPLPLLRRKSHIACGCNL